jgi:hypothetical protein
MIQNIINKEYLKDNIRLNIVFSGEFEEFLSFIKTALPLSSITNFTSTFYNINIPNIIICNDRSDNLSKSIELCKFFHIPLLLVDHAKKTDSVIDIPDIDFEPFYSISLSTPIYNSWNKTHDKILDFDIYNENNIIIWKDIINKLCKQTFMLKEI